MGFEEFKVFFIADKEGKKVSDLKTIYSDFRNKFSDLKNASSKPDMIANLQEYEAAHSDMCTLIPSEDRFYGVTRGANSLAPRIQWVFVPGVKDATEEGEESRTSALGQLLARTVRSKISFDEKIRELRDEATKRYQDLLEKEQSVLDGISESLQIRLSAWAHPNLSAKVHWKQDPEKSVRIEEPLAYIKLGRGGFEGELARFGHGLQRSYMLALLQELALLNDTNAPTLIMGIEEPELYQHPPQARYLAETLVELSNKGSQLTLYSQSVIHTWRQF